MAFPLLALLSTAGGIGAQAAGGAANAAATKEGAQTQAEIEAMNRAFQKEIFDAEMARQKPYYAAGLRNLPALQSSARYSNDPTQTGAYRAQLGFGRNALAGFGLDDDATLAYLGGNLTDAETEAGYNRLLDLERIGLGASGAAGSGAQNYANTTTASLINAGNALSRGTMGSENIRQGAYMNALGQASGLPAYISQQNYINKQNQPQFSNYGPYASGYQWGR